MTAASVNPLYETALNLAENLPASPTAISKVARATSEEAARWAFSQWSLRVRGAAKFERASEMLFDKDGLEMATHESVAAYHASLFPTGEPVVDLTVGIGADLIALAKRGPAVGFEIDAARAELARHNLKVHGVEVSVIGSSYSERPPSPDPFLQDEPLGGRGESQSSNRSIDQSVNPPRFFADPARRSGGKRSIDPDDFQPSPREIVEAFPDAKLGVIKLSPMVSDEFLDSFGGHVRFLSYGNECREALVLVGLEASGGRMAVHLESGEQLPEGDEPAAVEEPMGFLYEADPAAIRAHALGTLCEQFELTPLADSGGYLTGENIIVSPWLKGFRVVGSGRFDLSSLKKMLRDLDSSTPILKQRLANQDLQKLHKQLILKGGRELTVALYPLGKSIRQVVLEPLR